jgi:hypothetical protein
MNHEEAKKLLEQYAGGQLEASVREELEEHIAGCSKCRSILDETIPIDLGALTPGKVDERSLRRSVRRTLWRTALNAAVLLVTAFVVLAAVSTLVVQPLLMNRGGRAAAVARATYDVVGMFNEGAIVSDFSIDSGVFDRTFSAKVELPVGAGMADVGVVSAHIGVFGSVDTFWPYVDSSSRIAGAAPEVLARLGSGTVATVAARFYEPIAIDQAQLLADSSEADVSVIWAGFLLNEANQDVAARDPLRTLGYSTCVGTDQLSPRLFGASSADAGSDFGASPSSVSNALQEVKRSLNQLVEYPNLSDRLFEGGAEAVQRAATYLADNEPKVETLVVTGPTDEILKFLDEAGTNNGLVLAVDFYNWNGPVCGR